MLHRGRQPGKTKMFPKYTKVPLLTLSKHMASSIPQGEHYNQLLKFRAKAK